MAYFGRARRGLSWPQSGVGAVLVTPPQPLTTNLKGPGQMADEKVTLQFLVEQRRQILDEVCALRDDTIALRQDARAILDSVRQLRRLTEVQ
jgi:hypothetical protein